MNDPDCSLTEVGRVISADPAIALKALRLVNSAHYGLLHRVVSIEHAVMLLGLKVIRNLVLSAAVFQSFKKGTENLLEHCVSCGVAMRALLEVHGGNHPSDVENGFVYGLLHDVGKIIFMEYFPLESQAVEEMSRNEGVPSFEAERCLIGCDHAEMGARLAYNWKLPGELVSAIAGHHDLDQCQDTQSARLAASLSVADFICWASGLESIPRGASIRIASGMWDAAELTSKDIPPVLDRFFASIPEIRELTDIAR